MLVDRLLGIEEPFSRFPLESQSSTKPESSQEHVPQDFLSSLDKWDFLECVPGDGSNGARA